MKKIIFALCALLLALTVLVFAGCDKSKLRDGATTRPNTTAPAASEPTTTLGDRIESGLTDASEALSEGASNAGETLSRAAERMKP